MEDALETAAQNPAPLYLLWGEEFLVRKGAEELVAKILPDAAAGLNHIVLDGASPKEIAMELATLPLFPGRKLVVVRDPEFLAPKKGRVDALSKARDAWKSGRRKEGARRVLAIAARSGWGVKQLDPSASGAPSVNDWQEELGISLADQDVAFLKDVASFCREENVTAPESDVSALIELLDKGAPEGHVLVLAATDVDSKNPLVKVAKDQGELVERKVAGRLKDLDLSEIVKETLGPFKKKLAPSAEALLKDRCGGNMRLVQSELEKLAMYVDGPVIQAADVQLLIGRAREEEYLELSDALQKRDLQAALRYVDDAMGNGAHALLLLGSIAGITRSLLENHERARHFTQGAFPRSFDQFKDRVFPTIEAELKATKARAPHPYGVFLGMQAAMRYTRAELLQSLVFCADSDLALKSGGSGKLVIERLLWKLCGSANAKRA
ncbi:MAG: DNA polymerase III subunit delta [Myxococcaceae bacterium]